MSDAYSTEADNGTDGEDQAPESASYWLHCISDATTYFKSWSEKSDTIDKLYADLEGMSKVAKDREFQMFWANLEILKPSVYARPPIPVVTTRFKDTKDQRKKELNRQSAELLERACIVTFETEDVDHVMRQARDDLVTNGRGMAWLRLEGDKSTGDERVRIEHVDRRDYLHEPARKEEEIGWKARRSWLAREPGLKRFGESFLKAQFKSHKEQQNQNEQTGYEGEKKAEVWEIWSKTKKQVVWVSPGLDVVLDAQEPFLTLDGFYPCPPSAYSTTMRATMIPVPDFVYYKDQLEEINALTARIAAITEGLRLKGFYPGGHSDLADAVEKAIKSTDDNAILIPVSNFAALGAAGLKDSIVWLPLADAAAVIKELIINRRQLIDDVYQLTGLSDIMRGASDPHETLGAQELKSQYGSIRIRDRQAELVRFARDITRIAAEMMAENFSLDTLKTMTQIEVPMRQEIMAQVQQISDQAKQAAQSPQGQQLIQQNPQQAQMMLQQVQGQIQQLQQTVTLEDILELLQEQRTRPFILEIETDSTIQPNEDAEKQRRTEFLTAIGGFISSALPIAQQMPEAAPFIGDTLKFAAAPFRAGRALEGSIDEFVETLKQKAKQLMSQPPPPSPEQVKAQAVQQEAQLKGKHIQNQMDQQQQQHDLSMQNMQAEHAMKEQKHTADMAQNQQQHDHAIQTTKATSDGKRLEAGLPGDQAWEKMAQELEASRVGTERLIATLGQQLALGQHEVAQALAQLAAAQAAPKSITTPEGRTFTARTMN